jgi:hypothetical protein
MGGGKSEDRGGANGGVRSGRDAGMTGGSPERGGAGAATRNGRDGGGAGRN